MSELAVRDVAPVGARQVGTAVASSAIRGILVGPPHPGRILGTSSQTWWCAIDDTVVVITDDRAVRLPNSVVASPGPTDADAAPSRNPVSVGGGRLATRGGDWRVVRWWDPAVVPVVADPGEVAQRVRAAAAHVPDDDTAALAAAVLAGDAQRFVEAANRLIGRGVGLTPEGDDVLTGFIAGYRHAGASIGDAAAVSVLDQLHEPLLSAARGSTTLLSWSLLCHAFDGEVAAPVGSLLRALTGRGDAAAAIASTRAIGHRSGPALARGVVAGVAAACGVRP